MGPNGPVYIQGVLLFNPHKKQELWRFLTYMFVHSGYFHITFNVLIQVGTVSPAGLEVPPTRAQVG